MTLPLHNRFRAALALALLAIGACESHQPTASPAPSASESSPAHATAPTLGTDTVKPNPRGPGLDVSNYPVDDSRGSLGRVLAPFTDRPVPISAAAAGLWRAQGLRFLAVPANEIEALLHDLPLVGSVQRQSFTVLTRWTPVAIGGLWQGPRIIGGLHDPGSTGDLSLPPGRLRMLARAWDEPFIEPSGSAEASLARLRLELLPQHEQTDPDLATFVQTPRRPIDRVGKVFDELALRFITQPGEVYLIVPESPGVSWQRADEASNDQPAPHADGPSADPPSLGEAMLSNAAFAGSGRVKILVVLVPRSAEVFELLPSAPR